MHANTDIAQPVHALECFVIGTLAALRVMVGAIKVIERDPQRQLAGVGGIEIYKPLFDLFAHHRQHSIG